MPSIYVMRVLDTQSGNYVEWAPGSPIETAIIENVQRRLSALGVGIARTEAHVLADVETAFRAAFHELKAQV